MQRQNELLNLDSIPVELVRCFVIPELSDEEALFLEETSHRFKDLIDETFWEQRTLIFASNPYMNMFLKKFSLAFFYQKLSSWKRVLYVLKDIFYSMDALGLHKDYYYNTMADFSGGACWICFSEGNNSIKDHPECCRLLNNYEESYDSIKKFLFDFSVNGGIDPNGEYWIDDKSWADIVYEMADQTGTIFAFNNIDGIVETFLEANPFQCPFWARIAENGNFLHHQ